MTNYIQLGGENVQVAASHLGGTTIAPNGTAVALSLPTDTSCVYSAQNRRRLTTKSAAELLRRPLMVLFRQAARI